MLEILEKVNRNYPRDTVSHIPFLCEGSVTATWAQRFASNVYYSDAPEAVMMKSFVDNWVRSWLSSTEFSISLQKIVKEVITSSSSVIKVIEAVLGS